MTVKALVGYDIDPKVSRQEYEAWLWDIHVPDLLANPHLDRIVFNTVVDVPDTTSDGRTPATQAVDLYRVAELHFADARAAQSYRQWFRDHPIPPERTPRGRSVFRFYVLCESQQVDR